MKILQHRYGLGKRDIILLVEKASSEYFDDRVVGAYGFTREVLKDYKADKDDPVAVRAFWNETIVDSSNPRSYGELISESNYAE